MSMKLDVLQNNETETPWYADGLKFTCTQCGNCCTGGPGYVWISEVEIARLAEYLKLTPEETLSKYCRKTSGRVTLKERRTPEGNYDCIFLKEQPGPGSADGSIPKRRKTCSVYPVRPLQCRTWPFWPENLWSPEKWKHSGKRCHGMSNGHRHFTLEQIQTLRDAQDWPENPPTSGAERMKDKG
jgi:Fe-S-cluster containining protein